MMNKENYIPYTSPGNVLTIFGRIRKGWIPSQVDKGELQRVGITESMSNRTIAALEYYGLINEDGKPTDTWRAIATSSTNEYPKVLEGILRRAYPTIFEIHPNPADATDVELDDAFRKSEPANQRDRMVSLFRGLCQEAGLIKGEPLTRERKSPVKQTTQKTTSKNGDEKKAEPEKPKSWSESFEPVNHSLKWYNDLATLMGRLPNPENPQWTKAEKTRWLTALQSMLDLLIEEVESKNTSHKEVI
jgi:hypothetical protein